MAIPASLQKGLKLPVIEAPTVVVMPRDHPLAARAEVALRELSGVPLILLGRMRAPRREISSVSRAR